MKIAFNSFVFRQTPESPFTHYDGSNEELLSKVYEAFDRRGSLKGYRPGVCLVRVNPKDFYTGFVTLQEGDELVGEYTSRQEGEQPRQSIQVRRRDAKKVPCGCVEVVLYHHDTLAEDDNAETDAEWEIIAINGYPTKYPTNKTVPMDPMTLMHNHFGSDGGTATGMSSEEFEEALRDSFEFHKDKGLLKNPA